MEEMQFIFLLLGVLIGAALSAFYFKSKSGDNKDIKSLDEEKNNFLLLQKVLEEKLRASSELALNKEQEIRQLKDEKESLFRKITSHFAEISVLDKENIFFKESLSQSSIELKELKEKFSAVQNKLVHTEAQNTYLQEKLDKQQKETEAIGDKFTNEFKVLANQILEEKSKKFTELNQVNLEKLLHPLGENISAFQKKVEETYDKESKQRFSLEEKVKELVQLNQKISQEANNLTNALKGQVKKQGNWGEMILESILEKSGLVRGREYFIQEFIKDENGENIKNGEGRKLQPDVLINYPDNRKVVIDSKVSLVAYERYCSAESKEQQDLALDEHIRSLKKHIEDLSSKSYHEFAKGLDFVMMFIPIEPAYFAAMQKDASLWNYAYDLRIILISPTNLIAALKMILDLWKREYQNQNALEIAERGGQLYDKFVGLVENLKNVGIHLDRSQKAYNEAMGQLTTGRGNLIGQVEKLRKLGVKAKGNLPINYSELLDEE